MTNFDYAPYSGRGRAAVLDRNYASRATTAQLAAVGNAINTSGKFVGKMVFNTTTSLPVWANGPLATDTWASATTALAHTPA